MVKSLLRLVRERRTERIIERANLPTGDALFFGTGTQDLSLSENMLLEGSRAALLEGAVVADIV